MENKLYLYPGLIRIWHLLNALLIITLIISGLSMQYSDPLNPFIRFDLAVSMHNVAGFVLLFDYMLFIIGNTISKNSRHYRIQLNGLTERLMLQFRYYTYGVFNHQYASLLLLYIEEEQVVLAGPGGVIAFDDLADITEVAGLDR